MKHLLPGASLSFLMIDVTRTYRKAFDTALDEVGLELYPSEVRALAYITTYPGLRPTDIAEMMGIEKMSVSAFIVRLRQQGFVTSEVAAADRRARVVKPTESGQRIIESLKPVSQKVYLQAIAGLPEDQVATTHACLIKMLQNLGAQSRTDRPETR